MNHAYRTARQLFLGIALAAGAACTQVSSGALDGFFTGQSRAAATPTFTALQQAGRPKMVVSVDALKAAANFYLWTTSADGVSTWLTGNNRTISTTDGIITGTRGFGADILSSDTSSSAQLILARQDGIAERFVTLLAGSGHAQTQAFRCSISNQGPWTLDPDTTPIATVLMQEDCKAGDGSTFRNLYWVGNRSGVIIQSRQWANDTLGALVTRTDT